MMQFFPGTNTAMAIWSKNVEIAKVLPMRPQNCAYVIHHYLPQQCVTLYENLGNWVNVTGGMKKDTQLIITNMAEGR